MRIIVSDTSAIIDLKKGGLLDAFLGLPFEVVIPAALLGYTPPQIISKLNFAYKAALDLVLGHKMIFPRDFAKSRSVGLKLGGFYPL